MTGDYDDHGGQTVTDTHTHQGPDGHPSADPHADLHLANLPDNHEAQGHLANLPDHHDYTQAVAAEPALAHVEQAGMLHPLFEAVNSRLDDAAREHHDPPGKTSEATVHAVTHELGQTFDAVFHGGDVPAAANKFSDEFVHAITSPGGHDAIVHSIHAAGGAMQFAAGVMHGFDSFFKK